MTPPTKEIMEWCHELWGGKWKQTEGQLQNENGYCCLGVACKIFIPSKKQLKKGRYLVETEPIYQPHAPKWLEEINDDFKERTGVSLIFLNDKEHFTFPEIADLLYAVYILEVL